MVGGVVARSYAQFAAIVFLITGVGGLLIGDAGTVTKGQAGGNFDGVALHLTYVRDTIDILLFAAFAYAGAFAGERAARLTVLVAGAVLLILAAIGFVIGDDAAGTRGFAGLHFTLPLNILDLVAGVLAVLCGLGSLDEEASPA
jgi:hypothetical protein